MFALMLTLYGCYNTSSKIQTQSIGSQAAKQDNALTIEKMLIYAIEDESLTKYEYKNILDKYNVKTPFADIIETKKNHIARLAKLFYEYDLALPEDRSSQYALFPPSINDAYNAGVSNEIETIAMYERFLQQNLPTDIKNTFTDLKSASQSHLELLKQRQTKCLY
jgi:hypothetical protein